MSSEPIQATDLDAGDLVVLVDPFGRPRGTCAKALVHTSDTPLHLAFSVYLFDTRGRVLLTRRALSKATWPGVWSNSCCGHPRPGEPVEEAVRRRVAEELGVRVGDLTEVLPEFRYRATDDSGVVENEICPVFAAVVPAEELRPDAEEVATTTWAGWDEVVEAVARTPFLFSPWSALQIPDLGRRLPAHLGRPGPTERSHDLAECIQDVDALLSTELASLEERWRELGGGVEPDILGEDLPAWLARLLIGRGKRIRVSMAYWGYRAAGGFPGGYGYHTLVRIGAALEALHLFGLVHDDVMDESTSRRGRPAAHIEAASWHGAAAARGDAHRFGENLAVLLGDLAHTVADRLVDALPADLRRLWYDLCTELLAGQRADLTGAAAGRRDMEHARHVARLKSGRYTIERPLQLGAAAAGGNRAVHESLARCGAHIATAFALRDDYLGVWGDPSVTGKPADDDLAEGKATVILALAGKHLSGDAALALDRLGTRFLHKGDVAAVREALTACGVPETMEKLIAAEVDAAFECLDDSELAPAGIAGLKAATRAVAWRNS